MSIITCTSDCIYQQEGLCHLEQAASPGEESQDGCVHYVKKTKKRIRPNNRTDGPSGV